MKATKFTRYDCKLGRKRVTYDTLTREYACKKCGGRLVEKWKDGWRVECGRCGSIDFIHEAELRRQRAEAIEVLGGLPPELAEILE